MARLAGMALLLLTATYASAVAAVDEPAVVPVEELGETLPEGLPEILPEDEVGAKPEPQAVDLESPAAKNPAIHTVQHGETLWQIAAHRVGDPTLWPALYLANRDQIKDPSRVYPGQELAIPEIDPARADALRGEAATLTTQ